MDLLRAPHLHLPSCCVACATPCASDPSTVHPVHITHNRATCTAHVLLPHHAVQVWVCANYQLDPLTGADTVEARVSTWRKRTAARDARTQEEARRREAAKRRRLMPVRLARWCIVATLGQAPMMCALNAGWRAYLRKLLASVRGVSGVKGRGGEPECKQSQQLAITDAVVLASHLKRACGRREWRRAPPHSICLSSPAEGPAHPCSSGLAAGTGFTATAGRRGLQAVGRLPRPCPRPVSFHHGGPPSPIAPLLAGGRGRG